MFAFLLSEIVVIEVAYMTAEAFFLSGIFSSMYCRERPVVADQASFQDHHELFCTTVLD